MTQLATVGKVVMVGTVGTVGTVDTVDTVGTFEDRDVKPSSQRLPEDHVKYSHCHMLNITLPSGCILVSKTVLELKGNGPALRGEDDH